MLRVFLRTSFCPSLLSFLTMPTLTRRMGGVRKPTGRKGTCAANSAKQQQRPAQLTIVVGADKIRDRLEHNLSLHKNSSTYFCWPWW